MCVCVCVCVYMDTAQCMGLILYPLSALNLIILVGATLYDVNPSGGNQAAAWYTSVSIAFVTFLVILACQIFQQLSHTKLWKKFPKLKTFNKLTFKQAVNDSNYHVSQPTEAADVDCVREP